MSLAQTKGSHVAKSNTTGQKANSNSKDKKDKPIERLFWVDLEMSGLDPLREVVIEVAVIITDMNFTEIETYHSIVRQDKRYIDNMDEWNRTQHGKSGLIAKIPSGRAQTDVEKDLIALLKKHHGKDKAVLAGNSVGHDRLFIKEHFKDFAQLLHYRILDVTSWKIIMRDKFQVMYDKESTHRALDDVRQSIEELKFYLKHVTP